MRGLVPRIHGFLSAADFFRRTGKAYQSRINAVLRAYMIEVSSRARVPDNAFAAREERAMAMPRSSESDRR
jgi:hypothetical protein